MLVGIPVRFCVIFSACICAVVIAVLHSVMYNNWLGVFFNLPGYLKGPVIKENSFPIFLNLIH